MPDDWGQGVKFTSPVWKSRNGFGGTLTSFVSPDGKVFYHRWRAEMHAGRKFTLTDGFKSQLRLAQLQGKQVDESEFFKLLTAKERAQLLGKEHRPWKQSIVATVRLSYQSCGLGSHRKMLPWHTVKQTL